MLTEDDLRDCLFAVIEQRAALHRGKLVGPARRPDELIRKLFSELAALSRTRQSEGIELRSFDHDDDERIGSREAAEMIGWNIRRVQRRRKQLGGEMVRGRIEFHKSTIWQHIEGAAHER